MTFVGCILLQGLEWQEAMLVIASFSTRRLATIAPVMMDDDSPAKTTEKQAPHHDQMGHH